MESTEEYETLDLAPLREKLKAGVQTEMHWPQIELSSSVALVEGLTPHAEGWLKEIETTRDHALSKVKTQAETLEQSGGARGFCPPLETDRRAREISQRMMEETEGFNSKHQALLDELRQKNAKYLQCRDDAGGREAKVPSPWLEYGLLLPLVVLPEALLNFGAFQKAPLIASDAMALGSTLLVALGIAVAAHFIGLSSRQLGWHHRGDDHEREHQGAWPWWIGGIILVTCLVVVGAARYYYILPKIQEAAMMGSQPPSAVFSVLSMLFGNLLCFLIGAAFTFVLHDPNPEYEAVAKSRRKLQAQVDALRGKQLDPKVREITRRQATNRNEMELKAKAMNAIPEYSAVKQALDRVIAKDKEVEGLLKEYARDLATALQQNNPKVRITLKEYAGGSLSTRPLKISEYANLPIRLLRK